MVDPADQAHAAPVDAGTFAQAGELYDADWEKLLRFFVAVAVGLVLAWWLAFVVPAVVAAPRLSPRWSPCFARLGWALGGTIAAVLSWEAFWALDTRTAPLFVLAWWGLLLHRWSARRVERR